MNTHLLDLALKVGNVLRAQKLTIGSAESCTGGLLMSYLTDISGSSDYVMGGFITYSNDLKIRLANVSVDTLEQYGAVSAETAQEMAIGTLQNLDVDIAISITGIAGPGGGTPHHPVGLVYIGVAWRDGNTPIFQVNRYQWQGDRLANKASSVEAAFHMLLDILE
jgi:nicotinamide-nucleotide amidase